jgi:hypothetical protein
MKSLSANSLKLGFVAVAFAMASAPSAHAEKVSFNTPDQLKTKCASAGGTFVPPSGPTSSYECIGKNGAVVTCGGEGQYAGTCEAIPRKGTALRMKQLSGDAVMNVLGAGN